MHFLSQLLIKRFPIQDEYMRNDDLLPESTSSSRKRQPQHAVCCKAHLLIRKTPIKKQQFPAPKWGWHPIEQLQIYP
jgi:hypothetical protein